MKGHDITFDDLREEYPAFETHWNDLIHILTRIAESFVDRAFGIDSVQLANSYRQVSAPKSTAKVVKSKRRPLTKNQHAVSNDT